MITKSFYSGGRKAVSFLFFLTLLPLFFSLVGAVQLGTSTVKGVIITQPATTTVVNYSTVSVNDSQFLRGLTPQQVANLFTSPFLYNQSSSFYSWLSSFNYNYNQTIGSSDYTGWFHNLTSHVTSVVDSNDKVCIGTAAQCLSPSNLFNVFGGANITGMAYFDDVATFSSLTKNAGFTNNVSAQYFFGNFSGDGSRLTNLPAGSTYNSTYATYAYNQTYSGSTFNTTYNQWSYNQTGSSSATTIYPNNVSGIIYTNTTGGLGNNNNSLFFDGTNFRFNMTGANTAGASFSINGSTWLGQDILLKKGGSQNRYAQFGVYGTFTTGAVSYTNPMASLFIGNFPNQPMDLQGINGNPFIYLAMNGTANGGDAQVPFMVIAGEGGNINAYTNYTKWYSTASNVYIRSGASDPIFGITNLQVGNYPRCSGAAGFGGAIFCINSAGAGGRSAQFAMSSNENAWGQLIGGLTWNNINSTGDGVHKAVGQLSMNSEDEAYRYGIITVAMRQPFNDVGSYPSNIWSLYYNGKSSYATVSNTKSATGGIGVGVTTSFPDMFSGTGDISVAGTVAQRTVFNDGSGGGITAGRINNVSGWLENSPTTGYNCTYVPQTCYMTMAVNTTAGMTYRLIYNTYVPTVGFNRSSFETYIWQPSGRKYADTVFGASSGGNTHYIIFTAENNSVTIGFNMSAYGYMTRLDSIQVQEFALGKVKTGLVESGNVTLRGYGNETLSSPGGALNWWNPNGVIESYITHYTGTGWVNISGSNSSLGVQRNLDVREGTTTGNFSLTDTNWDDVSVTVNGLQRGVNSPVFDENTKAWYFEDKTPANLQEYVFGSFEMPHGWKLGTDLHCHIHTHPSSTNVGVAVYSLNYTWTNIGDVETGTTTTYLNVSYNGTIGLVQIPEWEPPINGTGKTLSSMIEFKLQRESASTADTFTGNSYVDNIGCHYEIDTLGSRQELVK